MDLRKLSLLAWLKRRRRRTRAAYVCGFLNGFDYAKAHPDHELVSSQIVDKGYMEWKTLNFSA
jgi:hypothetical protein